MATFLYIELNIFSIILLLIVYFNLNSVYSSKDATDQRLFKVLVFAVIMILIFDSGMWFFDGKQFPGATMMNYLVTIIYLVLNPSACLLWLLYGDFKINNNTERLKKKLPYYCIPFIINALLVLISIYMGWLFTIDSMNIYHRGAFMFLTPVLSFSYFAIVFFQVAMEAKRHNNVIAKETLYYFFIFPIPPIIGALIQMMYYGISVIWIGVVISIFVIFVNVQNNQIYLDQLTHLYNRRYLDSHFNNISSKLGKGNKFFVMMIDVDEFKDINDEYGHLSGDAALIAIADLLKKVGKKQICIIRFGGDEFVLIGRCNGEDEMEAIYDNVLDELEQFNSREKFPFDISVSIGCAIHDELSDINIYEYIRCADVQMYANKANRS